MRWIKRLLGLNTALEKKRDTLLKIRRQAMMAQRNGDLRTYSTLSKKIEDLEDEIVEIVNEGRG